MSEKKSEHELINNVLTDPSNFPGFRNSILWGIAGGIVVGCHKYRYSKSNPVAALNFGVAAFAATSTIMWYSTRQNFFSRRTYQNDLVQRMQTIPESERPEAAFNRSNKL